MRKLIALACFTALVVAGAGTAAAGGLFTGRDVKNRSLSGADIRKGSLPMNVLSRGTRRLIRRHVTVGGNQTPAGQGENGAQGPQGPQGPQGTPGSRAFSTAKWGVVGRNTFGSPVADFRVGPFGRTAAGQTAATQAPPLGSGSLGIEVGLTGSPDNQEKLDFSDQTDFAETKTDDLTALSYYVFVDEDSISGHSTPSVKMEVNPDANGKTYTTLLYLPDDSSAPSRPATQTPGQWQKYDAFATGNRWYATGGGGDLFGNGHCNLANPCSWNDMKAELGPNARITYSLGIQKGRDNPWHGAVDALRVNGTVFDFEPGGVFPAPAS